MRPPIPDIAINFLKRAEGFRAHVYKDSTGHDTIGYGHLLTRQDREQELHKRSISEEAAEDLLRSDALAVVRALSDLIPDFDLFEDGPKTALISLVFNIGSTRFAQSTLLQRILKGDPNAGDEFERWVYSRDQSTGRPVKIEGLIKRRRAESAMWKSPSRKSDAITHDWVALIGIAGALYYIMFHR